MEKLKKMIVPVAFIAAFYLFLHFIGVGCPIKFLSGISCPGCGMTRAAYSLLQLDFATAFHFHPLFPLVPVMVILFILRTLEKIPQKPYNIAIYSCCALFLAVWIFRLIFGGGEVISFEPGENIFIRAVEFARNLLTNRS